MRKFIVLTFGFLGWSFYELSGGAGYQPMTKASTSTIFAQVNSTPVAIGTKSDDSAETTHAERIILASTTPSSYGIKIYDAAEVDRSAIAPETAGEEFAITAQDFRQAEMDAAVNPGGTGNKVRQITFTAAGGAKVIKTSLATENTPVSSFPASAKTVFAKTDDVAEPAAPAVDAPVAGDIRVVKGDSVNLRSGPGTGFDVAGRLNRGTKVEVIDDAGNGWVYLRTIGSSQREGWMADFLIGKAG